MVPVARVLFWIKKPSSSISSSLSQAGISGLWQTT